METTEIIVLVDNTILVNYGGGNNIFFHMDKTGSYLPTEKEMQGEKITIADWKETVAETKSPIIKLDDPRTNLLYENALKEMQLFFEKEHVLS